MVEEGAPRIAPDVRAVPANRDHALARRRQVGPYLSVPLSVDGTSLFGTVCAVDLDPQPAQVVVRLPQVELQARLLPLCSPPTCGSTRRTAGPSGRKPTRYSSG